MRLPSAFTVLLLCCSPCGVGLADEGQPPSARLVLEDAPLRVVMQHYAELAGRAGVGELPSQSGRFTIRAVGSGAADAMSAIEATLAKRGFRIDVDAQDQITAVRVPSLDPNATKLRKPREVGALMATTDGQDGGYLCALHEFRDHVYEQKISQAQAGRMPRWHPETDKPILPIREAAALARKRLDAYFPQEIKWVLKSVSLVSTRGERFWYYRVFFRSGRRPALPPGRDTMSIIVAMNGWMPEISRRAKPRALNSDMK